MPSADPSRGLTRHKDKVFTIRVVMDRHKLPREEVDALFLKKHKVRLSEALST